MIIDGHAHIFPPLGGACGFADTEEHRQYLQLYIATHAQPTRRLDDHRLTDDGILGDGRYEAPAAFADGYRRSLDDRAFDGYWQRLRALGVPVFWEILGVPRPTAAAYLDQIRRLNLWADRYPDIPCILTHGVDLEFLRTDLPQPLERLLQREQFLIELLYPISQGRVEDYPYSSVQPAIRRLHQLVGGSRLVWGSDMPNVQRHCTYRQSRTYLEDHCTFLGSADLQAILGGNLARLFHAAPHQAEAQHGGDA